MKREPTEDEVRGAIAGTLATCDLVEKHGPLNFRPIIEGTLYVLATAIAGSENPGSELMRVFRDLPERVEEMKATFAASDANEPRN